MIGYAMGDSEDLKNEDPAFVEVAKKLYFSFGYVE